MTLKELRQRVADLVASGKEKNTEAKTLMATIRAADDVDSVAGEQERLAALNDDLDQIESDLATAREELEQAEAAANRDRVFADAEFTVPALSAGRSLYNAQAHPQRTHGFQSLGEFASAVHAASAGGGQVDDRLTQYAAPTNFHQERGGSAGEGYHVPPQFREEIFELVFAEPDIHSLIDLEPTSSNQVKVIRDETTPWGATGVQAYWRNESGQMSASKILDKETSVDLHELYAFCVMTDDLRQDAPRLSSRLSRQAARAIGWKMGGAVMTGTGSGQPDGYYGHAAEVVVAKESGQAADTLNDQNILKMYSRQLNPGRAVWLANQDILPQLGALTIGDQPAWLPPSGALVGAPGGVLLGRPVILTHHAKTLGDKGDLQFVDLQGYYGPMKSNGVEFAESMHLYFDYAMQAFRWRIRFGGRPYLSAPVTPASGSGNTLSHFVQLAERA